MGSDPAVYPWLDEGLADYAVFDYYATVFGSERAEELRATRWEIPTLSKANQGLMRGPVDRPASAMEEANYQLLAYAKSALFFDALRQRLGEEMYLKVIRAYVTSYRWRLATPQGFLGLAQRVSERNLNQLAETWLQ